MQIRPQRLVEHALDTSTSEQCIVIVNDTTSANLRWANNTLTTNGVMHSIDVTVIGSRAPGNLLGQRRRVTGPGQRAGDECRPGRRRAADNVEDHAGAGHGRRSPRLGRVSRSDLDPGLRAVRSAARRGVRQGRGRCRPTRVSGPHPSSWWAGHRTGAASTTTVCRWLRLDWISDGRLTSQTPDTRHTAESMGQPTTPDIDNLVLDVAGASGSEADLVAGMDDGLLLTCMWYIREANPRRCPHRSHPSRRLPRRGRRDHRGGEQLPLQREPDRPVEPVHASLRDGGELSREFGEDYFSRTATPALRIPDFNMSSVSQSSVPPAGRAV